MDVHRRQERVDAPARGVHGDGDRVDEVRAVVGQYVRSEYSPCGPFDDDLHHAALLAPRAGLAATEPGEADADVVACVAGGGLGQPDR